MSSAGHVLDMINRAKYNKYLKDSRKSRYKKVKDTYLKAIVKYKHFELKSNNLSKEEQDAIKFKIRNTIIKERRIKLIKTLIVSVLVVIVFCSFIYILDRLFN